jgi:hypothetical protein
LGEESFSIPSTSVEEKNFHIPFIHQSEAVSPHFNKLFFDFSRQTISKNPPLPDLLLNRFGNFLLPPDFCLLCSDTESHILIRCPSSLKLKMQLCVHYLCCCREDERKKTTSKLMSNEMLIQCPSMKSFAFVQLLATKLNSFQFKTDFSLGLLEYNF